MAPPPKDFAPCGKADTAAAAAAAAAADFAGAGTEEAYSGSCTSPASIATRSSFYCFQNEEEKKEEERARERKRRVEKKKEIEKKKRPQPKKKKEKKTHLEQGQPGADPGDPPVRRGDDAKLGGHGGVAVGAGPELGQGELEGLVLLDAVAKFFFFFGFGLGCLRTRAKREEEGKKKAPKVAFFVRCSTSTDARSNSRAFAWQFSSLPSPLLSRSIDR